MSEQTFKSPNFYEREIDLSGPAATGPIGVPAAVVGTSNKGPAFVPVTVANFNEFVSKFGNLDTKQFGPYAANEFLKHRSALTYVRVLGAGSNESDADLSNTLTKGIVKNAGFKLTGSFVHADDKRENGTAQFIVATHTLASNGSLSVPDLADSTTVGVASTVNLVRGLIFTTAQSRIVAYGDSNTSAITTATNDTATLGGTSGNPGKFKLIISSSIGSNFSKDDGFSGLKILTASFNPTDKDYFGKILNTDPDKFYQEQHYLHADFAVDHAVAYVDGGANIAIMSGSATQAISDSFKNTFTSYNTRFTAPKTTSFISQPFGSVEYDLFHFESLDDGEYANTLYKISISNVKASVNDANKYGTFNVQIRDWNDTDTTLSVNEQFTNCSLDPNSPNYIAKLIGDRKVYFNFDATDPNEKRIVATGKYPNNSRYVRVIVNDNVEKALVPTNSLPFGFRGPHVLNVNPNLKLSTGVTTNTAHLTAQGASTALLNAFIPPLPMRFKVTRGEIHPSQSWVGQTGASEVANVAYYWGTKFERAATTSDYTSNDVLNANVTNEKNSLLTSFTKFVGIEKLGATITGSFADSMHDNKFSLAKVALFNGSVTHLTSSINTHMKEAAYIRNAKIDPTDYTVKDPITGDARITFAHLLAKGSASLFNSYSSYAKFTNFMYGGFDGTNFLDRDARRMNDKSVSFDAGASSTFIPNGFLTTDVDVNAKNPSGNDVDNNGVVSYLTAVDIVTNPREANNNIVTVPGIREPYITDLVSKKVRDYGMAIHIMDIPAYSDSISRIYDDSTAKANVNITCSTFDSRVIDNNYVATYFPDVYIDDSVNRRKVKVPASVAAISALAFNDRVSYPWFAPAGFNRAALDFVTNVAVRLNVADRDRLYESRINPIATFPKLGYVIYGQKTLQINKSALDRVNVRRLMLEIKRIVSEIARRIVFEQNTPTVRNKFVADTSFQLGLVQVQAGIEAFQVIMNESNNTQEDADLNRLNGRIVVVPTRVVEFIAIDFIVTNSGVQFV